MKCFIHTGKEAIAACRKCGKGMCADCSSYSNHSGICPQCRREEFEDQAIKLDFSIEQTKKERTWYIVKLILLVWTIIYPLYALFMIFKCNQTINENSIKYNNLIIEINKLKNALRTGSGKI